MGSWMRQIDRPVGGPASGQMGDAGVFRDRGMAVEAGVPPTMTPANDTEPDDTIANVQEAQEVWVQDATNGRWHKVAHGSEADSDVVRASTHHGDASGPKGTPALVSDTKTTGGAATSADSPRATPRASTSRGFARKRSRARDETNADAYVRSVADRLDP